MDRGRKEKWERGKGKGGTDRYPGTLYGSSSVTIDLKLRTLDELYVGFPMVFKSIKAGRAASAARG
jgi:hypothetical protein